MADMLMTWRAIASMSPEAIEPSCLACGEEFAQAVERDPVGAAEPVDHQRHEHLRIQFEDPAHEGMLGGAPCDEDDLADQAPSRGGLTPGALGGVGDHRPELDDQECTDEPVEVVVAAVDGHPGHSCPASDLGQGQSAQTDLQNPLVGGAEHRIRRCRGTA